MRLILIGCASLPVMCEVRADSFASFALRVLDHDLRARMSKMARFRNLLVHLYWKVDDREVFRVINDHLEDFDRYLAAIGRYVNAEI